MLSERSYVGSHERRCLDALTLPVYRVPPELRHQCCEAKTMSSFKLLSTDTVIRFWCLRMAVRAQWYTRVIRGLHRHPAIVAGMGRLGSTLNAACAAWQRPNPSLVVLVARRTLPCWPGS